MMRKQADTTLLLIILGFVVFACVPQTPIPVYITPTPQVLVQEVTAVSTLGPLPSATATLTETPTSTDTPPAESPTPSDTPVNFLGAVVGPSYTLEPTETPRATRTPFPTETPTQPTATDTPSGPTPTPVSKLDPGRVGIQIDTNMDIPLWELILNKTQELGVGWVKFQANWAFLQPNGPNDFGQNFALFQLHVQAAKAHGFKVLISVAKAPNWARPSNQNESGPPDDPQLLGNFITFMLSKIGDRIDAVEIWNEPNLIREWTGIHPLTGEGYMRLFGPAYGAVRGYSPTMTIVTAGLAPTGNSPFSIDDRTFLQQMYNAGLGSLRDVVIGVHPYSWGNSPDARCCNGVDGQGWDDDPHFFFANNIEDYRDIMVQNGHADIQMWATEFGWATWSDLPGVYPDGEDWMAYNDVWSQANYTMRAFEIGQSLDYMGPMFLWNLNFANEATINERREIAAYSLLIPLHFPPERPLFWMLHEALTPQP